MQQIALQIKNIQQAKQFDKSYYIFDEFGGSIGSGNDCSFIVQDSNNSINEKHAEITFDEGEFLITCIGDSEIFYNGSFSKLLAGYEMAINYGDSLKIGDIDFICISPSKIDTSLDKENISDIQSYNKLDSINLEPRGKVNGLNIESNDELLDNNTLQDIDSKLGLSNITQENIESKSLTKINILNLIKQDLNTLEKSIQIDNKYNTLDIENISTIINNILLLDSNKVINLAILSIIIKELDTPIFKDISGVSFIDFIANAIDSSLNNNKELIEQLLIKALQKYINN
ncbi:FHA domain-containing protein [Helicobacter saguini]|uniref:FHA domain-containing protein n=1 Tax=Helicobacter saguini TaxID=1548018 RepID=A0A347VQX4_9HELI|nr:FHA domain-containing protein [Helicobacter saguini]MWV63121.1 FHA domain-containing protein [Helicobacter saguini]MWV66209.1 FHA domain-containing protein [Helicobacter saguini]MWV68559.1 FHA domain-containing protein [Helicobacter saguini]MWV71887.1 FHA domain-containing protein [Helicobacter saguini]TLD95902.1 FHA domain-containing protein [Helicobacter saguini]